MSGQYYSAIGRPGQYRDIAHLVESVNKWLFDKSIPFTWEGEHTSTRSGITTHRYEVYIEDEELAILFLLRWG